MHAEILERLSQHLSEALVSKRLPLSRNAKDGRLNSQENEREISQALELFSISSEWFLAQGLKIQVAPARHWFDFQITNKEGLFLPVNVKVSSLESSDNLSSKEGVFFALTGIQPNEVRINTWEQFCEQLGRNVGVNPDADYYFLVISKQPDGDVFWTSLKQIETLVPNGNNPPFQCNWGRNRNRIQRSNIDAQKYILNTLRETFVLRAAALSSFKRYLDNIFMINWRV